jgi:hypothetical protein
VLVATHLAWIFLPMLVIGFICLDIALGSSSEMRKPNGGTLLFRAMLWLYVPLRA